VPSSTHPSFLDFQPTAAEPAANPFTPGSIQYQAFNTLDSAWTQRRISATRPAALGRAMLAAAGWPRARIAEMTDREVLDTFGAVDAVRFVSPAEDAANALRAAGGAVGSAASSLTGGLLSAAPWLVPTIGLAALVFLVAKLK